MKILFLDDMLTRVPIVRPDEEVHYVRSFTEFQEWLRVNGTPDVISYDHDLDESHYTAMAGYNAGSLIPNGEDAALWAIQKGYIPLVAIVHSWNEDGAKRIANRIREGSSSLVLMQRFSSSRPHIPDVCRMMVRD